MPIIYKPDSNGMIRPVDTGLIDSVDKLIDLKKESGSNPWPVIEKLFELWKISKPTEWKSYIIYIKETRDTRKDKKFACGKEKFNPVRYTLDIPQWIMLAIRMIYSKEELPMDKVFFRHFAKHFPKFKIAEKI